MKSAKLSILVLIMALGAGLAQADKKSDAEAKRLYQEGTKYYSIGEFTKAIENYKKAFELKPDPVLLYNIAQAYRLSNDFDQSLFFYKSFLRNMPTAANREEVEGRIKQVEAALAQKRAAGGPPNEPVAPGTNPPPATDPTTTQPTTTEPTTPQPTTTKLPGPDQAAAASAAGTENQTPPTSGPMETTDHGGKRPIYKKWWFWAGIGAVAVGTVVVVAASSGGGSSGPPGSHFGATDAF